MKLRRRNDDYAKLVNQLSEIGITLATKDDTIFFADMWSLYLTVKYGGPFEDTTLEGYTFKVGKITNDA